MEKHEMELKKENGAWVVRYCIDGAVRKFRTYDAARRYFIAVGSDQITTELHTPKRGTVVPVPPELKQESGRVIHRAGQSFREAGYDNFC